MMQKTHYYIGLEIFPLTCKQNKSTESEQQHGRVESVKVYCHQHMFRLPNNSHAPSNVLLVHTFIIVFWFPTPKDTKSQTAIDLDAQNMCKDEAKT